VAKRVIQSLADRAGDEAEYVALRELGSSVEPVGSWRICTVLRGVGIELSEATAGRLLRQFDLQGLTQALGSKGRILTDEGRRHLALLEEARSRNSYHNDLAMVVSAQTVEDLLDVLHARRLIEAETARLAALHATSEEIEEIDRAVQRHIEVSRAGGASLENNVTIHLLIARASRSRMFQAIVGLILQDQQLHQAQNRIQRAVGEVAPEDHLSILHGIRTRDPEAAAAAMRAHIDRLIRGCEATIRAQQEKER
jgi:GntR family L-lactate dehydrogenase operon transcriptional regulator